MKNLGIVLAVLALGAGSALAHPNHDHGAKAAAGATQTVSGELVDMMCFMNGGEKGEKHAKCASMCVTGGAPMGLLTKGGDLYLVLGDHADEKPFAEAKKMAGGDAKLTGRVSKTGGVQALIVSKAEKL